MILDTKKRKIKKNKELHQIPSSFWHSLQFAETSPCPNFVSLKFLATLITFANWLKFSQTTMAGTMRAPKWFCSTKTKGKIGRVKILKNKYSVSLFLAIFFF